MKRLIPSVLLFPLLTSCVQPEYYDAGYYHSVPPRSEIYDYDERPHDYRHPYHDHREHKNGKVKVHHPEHGQAHQVHNYQKQTVETPSYRKKIHTHEKEKSRVIQHPSETGSTVIIQHN